MTRRIYTVGQERRRALAIWKQALRLERQQERKLKALYRQLEVAA